MDKIKLMAILLFIFIVTTFFFVLGVLPMITKSEPKDYSVKIEGKSYEWSEDGEWFSITDSEGKKTYLVDEPFNIETIIG